MGGDQYELSEEKEIEAIAFIMDEIDLILDARHKYRPRFNFIKNQFFKNKNLNAKEKKILLKIYEVVTDLGFGVNEH